MSAAGRANDLAAKRAFFADDLSYLFPNLAHGDVIAQALEAGALNALRQMFAQPQTADAPQLEVSRSFTPRGPRWSHLSNDPRGS